MTDKIRPTSAEVRQQYLDFFAGKGHTIVPSASLAPMDDPTLLFTNAGMNQFKEIFLDLREPVMTRVADSQKCMRVSGKHNDLDDVGRSPYHHTFFEMLGNWSFGDYYKREAIVWAWELLTGVWGLPKARLWATVFEDDKSDLGRDTEAADIWQRETDINPAQVLYFGRKDNFWEMGDTGPCGPCSEIHLDMGPGACNKQGVPGHVCGVNGDCRRYIELWNLVFIQYNHTKEDTLVPLPAKHVDTGMGFERIVNVLQGVNSNYETDLFAPIIRRTRQLLGASSVSSEAQTVSYQVIADHIRAMTFLIGDGVLPANDGRGYVLRLILRRAARHGRMLGFTEPFLAELAKIVVDIMGPFYADLVRRQDFILTTIEQEEARFGQTLTIGLALLDEVIADLKAQGRNVIPGKDVFRLHDTHGFPLDLTRDVARDHGLTVDVAGYEEALAAQRTRARAAAQFDAAEMGDAETYLSVLRNLKAAGTVAGTGVLQTSYEGPSRNTLLAAIVQEGRSIPAARPGDKVEVVLPETPFYPESGGQVSDTGEIAARSDGEQPPAWRIRVDDMRMPAPGLIVHVGEVLAGAPTVGDPAVAVVDHERRLDIMRNHTATHLLDTGLRTILGTHVQQAGSVVAPNRLRFDFTHAAMLTENQIDALEQTINDAVLANYPVLAKTTSYQEAVAGGAIALFTEKYGDEVRVIQVGEPGQEISQELCGGTHVAHTGEIGLFHILSEESVGAGVRRIEAVTGRGAQRLVQDRLDRLDEIAALLRVPADQVEKSVQGVYAELLAAQKEIARLKAERVFAQVDQLVAGATILEGVAVVAAEIPGADMDTLRALSDQLRDRLGSAVVLLATAVQDKPQMIAAVTDDLIKRRAHAGRLVKAVAEIVGGGGGGKPSIAQAGGRDLAKLPEALAAVVDLVREQLGEGQG